MIPKLKICSAVIALSSALGCAPLPAQAPAASPATPATLAEADHLYREAAQQAREGHLDTALTKATEALKLVPDNVVILALHGDLNAKKKAWIDAEADFNAILKINPDNALAKFDLAEIKLLQKQYDTARAGFLTLTKDTEFADLAAYKVYLCDLFSQNQMAATKELAAFNEAGIHASYHYANAAHHAYLGETEETRHWLASAAKIYPPAKVEAYSSTLKDFGYLPLPPAPEK